jgi:hypothetical protein
MSKRRNIYPLHDAEARYKTIICDTVVSLSRFVPILTMGPGYI